jgi:GT2 family glycosyltransferase
MNKFAHADLSIVIVTRNRCAEATAAVESALAQQPPAAEIRVYDNASEDGTSNSLKQKFPEIVVHRFDTNRGACHARNLALRESPAEFVLFMDDDSYFTAPQTAHVAVEYLRAHPQTAAIGLPFIEPRSRGMRVWTPPPEYRSAGACPVRSVVTCACVVRRESAAAMGGFREDFQQWGEERDFCIRLMSSGWSIDFIQAPPLVHLGSAARDLAVMQYLGIRNTLLFDVLNVPLPWMPWTLLRDAARLFLHKLTLQNTALRFAWVCRGLAEAVARRRDRRPVPFAVFQRYRKLPGHGPVAAVDILPPPLTRRRTLQDAP